eukprot:12905408-Alexandrium_andersonii.AAC.1
MAVPGVVEAPPSRTPLVARQACPLVPRRWVLPLPAHLPHARCTRAPGARLHLGPLTLRI